MSERRCCLGLVGHPSFENADSHHVYFPFQDAAGDLAQQHQGAVEYFYGHSTGDGHIGSHPQSAAGDVDDLGVDEPAQTRPRHAIHYLKSDRFAAFESGFSALFHSRLIGAENGFYSAGLVEVKRYPDNQGNGGGQHNLQPFAAQEPQRQRGFSF